MHHQYRAIARAIAFIRDQAASQPDLAQIAAHVGLSPFHFQRLFRSWAGVSPKRYLEHLTVARAKSLLATDSVLATSLELGLSSPGRLHDHFVTLEALTPGEYKARGRDLEIAYAIHHGPLGRLFVAESGRGVCLLAFVGDADPERERIRLQRLYPRARLRADVARTRASAVRVSEAFSGRDDGRFHLGVRGTNLQLQVWRALLRIPAGSVVSYQQLAARVGRPDAIRAVANAVAANPVNYLIPCHRILRADGSLGGFRGGARLKAQLLLAEVSPSP